MKVTSTKEKIKVHIDEWDIWNMDITLAHIIVPMLKQLKKSGCYPEVDNKDLPEHLRHSEAKERLFDKEYSDRWNWVLDEMIWTFKKIKNDSLKFENFERIDNGLRLFGKYYRNLWD